MKLGSINIMSTCNLCNSEEIRQLIDFGQHPVAKHYLNDKREDQPTWPVKLYFCERCGLTQLVDSCPPEVLYDNYVTLSSWKNQPHVQMEIDMIKNLDGIDLNSKVIEIGSNDGMFLEQMSLNGFESLLGIEPAKDAFDSSIEKEIHTINSFLTPELSSTIKENDGEFDLFLSRQNLEHISDLQGMIDSIKILVKSNGYVLIEVPNYSCNLKSKDYSLWEEHVNYFTLETLSYFLSLANVKIVHHETILFSGEGIIVIGQKVENVECLMNYVPALRILNDEYAANWPAFYEHIHEYLGTLKKSGKKIAVYGAGSRVFCLINFTGISRYIHIIVDDQPEKQNKYMPGGEIPIVSSDALNSESIDICLLAVNTENEDKVINKHGKWSSGSGIFWSVLPPSNRLLPIWDI